MINRNRKWILLAISFLAATGAEAASLCSVKPPPPPTRSNEKGEACNGFREEWVSEFQLKRNPKKLLSELDSLKYRLETDAANLKCIKEATKKEGLRTEEEIKELRKLNSKNIQSALVFGAEKSRLRSEHGEVRRKLVEKTNRRTRMPWIGRNEVLSNCLYSLSQVLIEIDRLEKQLKP